MRRSGDVLQAHQSPALESIIRAGHNYGWPIVSYGRQYAGPNQSEIPYKEGMELPLVFWVPSIATSGMTFYTGDKFPQWKGNLFIGAQLGGTVPGNPHLERITLDQYQDETARETMLLDMKQRVRDVRQGPDGLVYVLTDEDNGSLIRIEPAQ